MTAAAHPFAAELIALADKARASLEAAPATDPEALMAALRDALDVGVVLGRATDRGVPLTWATCASIEQLLRATARTYPPLAARERAAILARAPQASLYSALSARALNAQLGLAKSLEVTYRSLIRSREES